MPRRKGGSSSGRSPTYSKRAKKLRGLLLLDDNQLRLNPRSRAASKSKSVSQGRCPAQQDCRLLQFRHQLGPRTLHRSDLLCPGLRTYCSRLSVSGRLLRHSRLRAAAISALRLPSAYHDEYSEPNGGQTRTQDSRCFANKIRHLVDGERTRARTLDPLIKRQPERQGRIEPFSRL